MKDPLGVSPSKGNQGTARGKEKFLLTSVGIEPTDLRIRSTITLPTELRGRTERYKRGKEKFLLTSVGIEPTTSG